MQSGYQAPDIDVTSAQRQAADARASFVSFTSVRALTSGAGALSTGTRAARPGSAALNDLYFETDTFALYYWSGTTWAYLTGVGVGTNTTRAAITVTANDNGFLFYTTDTGKLWRVEGGVWVDKFVDISVTTGFKVGTNYVVKSRGAAVADVASADATDLATAITLANETKAQVNALLARLRAATGHGLIA